MPIKHVSGPTIEQMIRNLDDQKKSIQNKVIKLADQTTVYMRSQIKPRRDGSTGNLERAIESIVSVEGDKLTAGVAVNQEEAPYWYVVNYGKKVTGETFVPGMGKTRPVTFDNGGADSAFRGNGKSEANFIGNISKVGGKKPKAITPMKYIEKTQIWLNKKVKTIFK